MFFLFLEFKDVLGELGKFWICSRYSGRIETAVASDEVHSSSVVGSVIITRSIEVSDYSTRFAAKQNIAVPLYPRQLQTAAIYSQSYASNEHTNFRRKRKIS